MRFVLGLCGFTSDLSERVGQLPWPMTSYFFGGLTRPKAKGAFISLSLLQLTHLLVTFISSLFGFEPRRFQTLILDLNGLR